MEGSDQMEYDVRYAFAAKCFPEGSAVDGVESRLNVQGPDLQNILRLPYDYVKVTIDLRRTSYLSKNARFFQVRFTCEMVRSSEIVFVN